MTCSSTILSILSQGVATPWDVSYNNNQCQKSIRQAFGSVGHKINRKTSSLLFGMEDGCKIPVSRWTSLSQTEIDKRHGLRTLMTGSIGGPCVIRDETQHITYFMNHLEYDDDTLAKEYERDLAKGVDIDLPISYFPNDDPRTKAPNVWFGSAKIFYANWLNLVHSKKPKPPNKLSVIKPATVDHQHYNRVPNPCEIGLVL